MAELIEEYPRGVDPLNVEPLREGISLMVPLFEDVAADLEKIQPPKDIEQTHVEMISGLSGAADFLRDVGELLDKPLGEALEEVETIDEGMDEFMQALKTVGDLPPEYEAALETEPKCQEMEEILGGS